MMRTVFLGTAELACPCLEAIYRRTDTHIPVVFTQPDRPKGRELKLAAPPVKRTAQHLGLPVEQPEKIRSPDAIQKLQDARPDLIVVVAYGQILPGTVLEIPRLGCVNVHASLLPRWRGAAPIQYAILAGDTQTGVTTMHLNAKMDEGDIILQRAEPILPDDTAATLHDRLAKLGATLIVETIDQLANGCAPRIRQDDAQATYARKISKEQGRIDWKKPAVEIERTIRAFNPWPTAYCAGGETMLKIWRAQVLTTPTTGVPGELTERLSIVTGQDELLPEDVQSAGGRRMTWEEFLRGHRLSPGMVLT